MQEARRQLGHDQPLRDEEEHRGQRPERERAWPRLGGRRQPAQPDDCDEVEQHQVAQPDRGHENTGNDQ